MNAHRSILLKENNIISLRTAYVIDIGNLIEFRLQHDDLASKIPKDRTWWAPKDFEWVKDDSVWLYRRLRSPDEELKLKNGVPTIDLGIKPMSFDVTPAFKFIWNDSGHSVAVSQWNAVGFHRRVVAPGIQQRSH